MLASFFRLHEFDDQVRWVREGMAKVIPVPLLSLFTGYELETMVSCSQKSKSEKLNIFVSKKMLLIQVDLFYF